MVKNNNFKKENNFISQLKELYDTMLKSQLSEVEVKSSDYKLKIKRIKKYPVAEENVVIKKVFSKHEPEVEVKEEIVGETIDSPINGIFYIAPSPSSPPFVNEGDIVNPGTTVCIVEAMKVMNEIKVDKKCKILKVLCVNGTSVNTGTKLFLVQPV
ncbi:MAG: biotin/lipoyl-containing protein [Endomicrobiia bacterium]